MAARLIGRHAGTGRFVTLTRARKYPNSHVVERVTQETALKRKRARRAR